MVASDVTRTLMLLLPFPPGIRVDLTPPKLMSYPLRTVSAWRHAQRPPNLEHQRESSYTCIVISGIQRHCFIAMRIGDPQTDDVYDRLIKPAVRSVGLSPRRVDRVLHNERNDQRIVRE